MIQASCISCVHIWDQCYIVAFTKSNKYYNNPTSSEMLHY